MQRIAIAELIVSGSDWTPELIADHFARVFRRDPRAGYAKRFRSLLTQVNTGAELLARIEPTSDRNGAAMRAPVIGLIDDLRVVIDYARRQAAITHNTEGGIDSAVAAAIICHFFVYGIGSKEDLPAFLSEHLPRHPWTQPWSGPVPCHGISTIQAVVTSLLATDSLSDVLRRSVAFTGDVDSVATIACACASVSPYFKKDIPRQPLGRHRNLRIRHQASTGDGSKSLAASHTHGRITLHAHGQGRYKSGQD